MNINIDHINALRNLAMAGHLTEVELLELTVVAERARLLVESINEKYDGEKYKKYFSTPVYSIVYDKGGQSASSIKAWDLYKVSYNTKNDMYDVVSFTYHTTIGGDVALINEEWANLRTSRDEDVVDLRNLKWVYDHVITGLILSESEYNDIFVQLADARTDINRQINMKLSQLTHNLDTIASSRK